MPISRWSRGSKSKLGRSPTSRRTTASSSVIPSGRVGVGQVGQRARRPARARPRPSPARPCRTRSSPSAPCTVGDQLLGVLAAPASPRRSAWRGSCARPGRPRSRAAARGGGRRGRAARRRRSAAPRRASAALTRSGSERISFRSSIGRRAQGEVSPGRGDSSASSPAYLATKRATASASSPTTMFWGMIAPGEAAVLDREERVFVGLGSLVEVRPLRAHAAVAGALGAGGAQRVAAGAVGGEEDGPVVVGVVLGDRDPFFAEAAGGEAEGRGDGQCYEQCWAHAARIILSGADPD